ncbi:MAG: ABC transporter ATP-binding protein/permease [Defluviitaleaceae bacterium]|nr:ABC transporter ATP-binding protein/permease [Defluviitaleaceae bacterium]
MKKKEKPMFTVRQNSAYVIKKVWDRDRYVLWLILVQIILAVALATVAIFLPATVVEQITADVPLRTMVITILSFTVALTLMHAINSYISSTMDVRRMYLRIFMNFDVLEKVITTDYASLEEKAFSDSRQKAMENLFNNNASSEQVYVTFTNLGINLLGFIVYILLLAAVNPLIMAITAVTAVLGVIARQWANKWRHTNDNMLIAPAKRTWYTQQVGSDYSLSKDIRLFGMVRWVKEVYESNLKLIYSFHRKAHGRQLVADVVAAIASFAREGIAYGFLIWLVIGGELSVDGFVLMFAAVGGFSTWVMGILNEYAQLNMHSLNICRIREFYEYPPRFKWNEGEPIAPIRGASYSLELKNVSFRYHGADTNALENINLSIKPGEKLAVVGLNGAGKTTIVKLLCGLYDPTQGQVLLNGQDIRIYNREDYYSLFTAVFQEFNILPVSISDNLTNEGKNADITRLNNCLRLAGLDEKIASLQGGIDSLLIKDVHPEAVELSGGETQRLMLARALYKDAPLLILDEPTAALDPIAESQLYEKYNELSHGRTSIYISHRLASTRFCDRIILVSDKTIAEEGTHDQLMAKGGQYAELFDIQSKYYKENVPKIDAKEGA